MRVSLNWLADYIALPTDDVARIREAFESLGHEVEGIEYPRADWTEVVIAEVVSVEPHPDADKVRLCQVVYDDARTSVDVVCGAWNFDVGAIVPFAKPGAILPGGFEIGTRKIRGVQSNGMICSERELGIGDDAAGILVLDADAPVGTDFADFVALPDVIFDLSITPNRPDAMSMMGIARELSAYFDVPYAMVEPDIPTVPGTPSTTVEIQDPSGCLRFTGREIQNVEIGPSPFWLRQRLRAAGVRAISNAVDVTNYVMLELGHPLHSFDADRIAGEHLIVRRSAAGEKMITLDDVERTLSVDDLVICDETGPISLAGTMGGATSEVSAETSRVFLEAATWDPPTIMWMSRRHGLRSEASSRFERGVDPGLPLRASSRAAQLLAEMSGATVLAGVVDEVAVAVAERTVELPMSVVTRTLGQGFDADQVARLLAKLELGVSGEDPLSVVVPTFRPDLERPIDLVEEVARLHGFDRFGESLPRGSASGLTIEQRRERRLRSALTGAGLHQAVHLSFMDPDDLDLIGYPADDPARHLVRVRNPLREEEGALRTTLLPGLLASLRYNASHGAEHGGLFETGRVFFSEPDEVDSRIPDQPVRLGFALFGVSGGLELGGKGRQADAFTASALARLIAEVLDLEMELTAATYPGFHPGRCAEVRVDGRAVGQVGEVHPVVVKHYGLEGRVAGGELDLSALVASAPRPQLVTPSVFPRSEFDLAFVIDRDAPASDLLATTIAAAGDLVESAEVFDEYRGLEDGRKSLAIHYVLRAGDRTLSGDDVAPVRAAMIEAAAASGAELRGRA
jgi:phenylalanyl-tRNA synthetase beta chain